MFLNLVALSVGKKKAGGNWYRATFKHKTNDGSLLVKDFFLPDDVGEKMVANRILEDHEVNVSVDLDDFLRPVITDVELVEG